MAGLQPYIKLVTLNHDYRRLWLSQLVSNFGDWFGLLAVYALITEYSDSELLLGLIIVVKMMSLAVFSPIAGYITDRFNRRRLMIWCDLARAVIVLGFLFIHSLEWLWLSYVLMALQMMMSAVFEPARTSSIPNITSATELVNANILSSLSWSIIFTMGMGIGGLATGYLGTSPVFILDALSYLVSAYFIYRAVIPQKTISREDEFHQHPLRGIKEGFQFLKDHPHVLRPTLAKGFINISLGALVYLLVLVSDKILLMGSVGLGLLYASRGVGTAIGPVIGRRVFRDEGQWIKAMGIFMFFCGLNYLLLGFTQSLLMMLLLVFLAHAASGSNWVMSTVLLQRRAPDVFRGRVFSTEWLFFTLTQSVSVITASLILDNDILTLDQTIVVFSVLLVVTGIVWNLFISSKEKEYQRNVARLKAEPSG